VRRAVFAILVVAIAGCGGGGASAGPSITVQPARVYSLAGFAPGGAIQPGHPTTVAFAIQQPDGKPLTSYRTGPGPHTGVHLIVVDANLRAMIHRHPPIAADGRISEPITFPRPGRYRVVVDAYPSGRAAAQPGLQLFKTVTVAGNAAPWPLPPFRADQTAGGLHFAIQGTPQLKSLTAATMNVSITARDGHPVAFQPLYGAIAHAIFFRAGSLDYFHTHICSPGDSSCTGTVGSTQASAAMLAQGQLRVGVLLPESGTWRLFLQVQVDGKPKTAAFTLNVR
jgi:hypothetical protein